MYTLQNIGIFKFYTIYRIKHFDLLILYISNVKYLVVAQSKNIGIFIVNNIYIQ